MLLINFIESSQSSTKNRTNLIESDWSSKRTVLYKFCGDFSSNLENKVSNIVCLETKLNFDTPNV